MSLEQESKFALENVLDVQAVLDAKGVPVLQPWHFESNILYDSQGRLRHAGRLLRLRRAHGQNVLTYKQAQKNTAGVKICQEIECTVSSATAFAGILDGLAYSVVARYEKFRAVWEFCEARLFLDILPFGHFLEIEALPQSIPQVAEMLGFSMEQAMSASYHDLYALWRQDKGLPPHGDFVFTETEKKSVCTLLGLESST